MEIELNSFDSVRQFCADLQEFKLGKPVDRLICNAAVYQPSLPYAKWSVDGHEQQMQINYLSHFLLVSLLMEDVASAPDPRVIMVGSVTGNDNTVGGGGGTQSSPMAARTLHSLPHACPLPPTPPLLCNKASPAPGARFSSHPTHSSQSIPLPTSRTLRG